MCRYGFEPYKTSYVCVPCRHVAQFHWDANPEYRCPTCREPLVHAGSDFHAPRKRNKAGWDAVALVLASGKNYHSCGCNGPGWRPSTPAKARQHASTSRPWRP